MTALAHGVPSIQVERASLAKRLAPGASLALVSPFIAEVLSGATRLSYIFVFATQVMFWGVGALLIREATVRWGRSWLSVLLLGLALSVAEEFVVQQTSIAPLVWVGSGPIYGRAGGVNWPYFLYMLGYETVWVVLVPIQLTELLFPARRQDRWVSTRGIFALAAVFLMGAVIAWYSWTQHARTQVFHAAPYDPPAHLLLAGLAAIVALCALAHRLRLRDAPAATGREAAGRASPRPGLICLGVLVLGLAWQLLLSFVLYIPHPPPVAVAMLVGVAWSLLGIVLIRRWCSGRDWGDRHAWALTFGALLACMLPAYVDLSTWSRLDLIGKVGSNVFTVAGMLALGAQVWRRPVGAA